MLSHLRFHRRGTSNPNSPGADQPPPSPFNTSPAPFIPDATSPGDGRPLSSGSTGLPPTLPPIERVTSADTPPFQLDTRHSDNMASPDVAASLPVPTTHQHSQRLDTRNSGFIGGVKYRQQIQSKAALGLSRSTDNLTSLRAGESPRVYLRPPSSGADSSGMLSPQAIPQRPASSFSTPTDLQTSVPPVGMRPAGSRLSSEPPKQPVAQAIPVEGQKTKRGLPFLKNPMSTLLARRRANHQNQPDVLPAPLITQPEEPAYDPRIRGTRVHDFSAPRRKVKAPHILTSQSSSQVNLTTEWETRASRDSNSPRGRQLEDSKSAPQSARSGSASTTLNASGSVSSQQTWHSQVELTVPEEQEEEEGGEEKEEKEAAATVEEETTLKTSSSSLVSKPSRASRKSVREPPVAPTVAPAESKRTTSSRTISLDTLSSIPRHMKSTSSRFSFDMIPTNSQEQIMEERHRQKELERQVTDPRDSRFDEFDEDAFDYDAMMDDDGLEERIPGVNADYDEEDDFLVHEDPVLEDDTGEQDDFLVHEEPVLEDDAAEQDKGNDQENFSGFVFQRSNPISNMTSPQSVGMMSTPRDGDGNVIGFAMSKDSPAMIPPAHLEQIPTKGQTVPVQGLQSGPVPTSGLGIQGMNVPEPGETPTNVSGLKPSMSRKEALDDDLYFDNGLLQYENEFAEDLAAEPEYDRAPFDESIFDMDDTDQFGRPVPGAFARAQSVRNAQHQSTGKRQNDGTSRHSAQSGVSQSTAQTSVSERRQDQPREPPSGKGLMLPPPRPSERKDSATGYHAALAAAAVEAEKSGKFQRSPSPATERREQSNQDKISPSSDYSQEAAKEDNNKNAFADDVLDDGGFGYEDMGDFELDDDAIIAEANASALAYDPDGWYGQEFGFYSGPANTSHNAASGSAAGYEYSNGGFFGPKGMAALDMSQNGRMISREPNLTPITERSEYSNRNSLMSFGMPGAFASGTPVLQSPGLAQLAMMQGGADDMSLSALLKLRSKAWGGSQASLPSSRDGSPRSERGDGPGPVWGYGFPFGMAGQGPMTHGMPQARKGSLSQVEPGSENGSASGSPTLTMADFTTTASPAHSGPAAHLPIASPQPQPRHKPTVLSSTSSAEETRISAVSGASSVEWPKPLAYPRNPSQGQQHDDRRDSTSSRRQGVNHRHKGSADSISYRQEEESGETRWVMERRRTGEGGEVEILEREIVEGSRI